MILISSLGAHYSALQSASALSPTGDSLGPLVALI